MSTIRVPLCIVAGLVACACIPVMAAAGKAPAKEMGTYKDWNDGTLDQLQILETPNFATATKIVVLPVDTSATPVVSDKKKKVVETVRKVLASAPELFVAGIKKAIAGKLEVVTATEAPTGDAAKGTILVRAEVSEMNPGSGAARFWLSMGAGHTRAELKGEILDGETGKPLLKFTQARAGSRVAETELLLRETVREVGEDVGATILVFR